MTPALATSAVIADMPDDPTMKPLLRKCVGRVIRVIEHFGDRGLEPSTSRHQGQPKDGGSGPLTAAP